MIRSTKPCSPGLCIGVVLVLAGCASGMSLSSGRGGVDGARLVAFTNAGAVSSYRPAPSGVLLDSPAEEYAFAEGFAGGHPEVASMLRTRMSVGPPRRDQVLLGFSGLGCAEDSAELTVTSKWRGLVARKWCASPSACW